MSDELKNHTKPIIDSTAEVIQSTPIKNYIKPVSRTMSAGEPPHSSIECCVHCGSIKIKKHGTTTSGVQRYICKDCNKSFAENYGLITHYTHLSEFQWKEAIRCTLSGESISTLAKNISVSTKTAWLCRMKIYQTLKNIYGYCDTFNSIVEADGKYERISFKGKKDKNFFIDKLGRLPRHNRSRSERIEYLGSKYDELFVHNPHLLKEMVYSSNRRMVGRDTIDINHQHICILTAIDRSNNIYIEPITAGSAKSHDIYDHLSDKLSHDAILVTDDHHGYKYLTRKNGIQHIIIDTDMHVNGSFSLARVNSLHSAVDRFFGSREFQPATKYLDLYLMMLWWLEKNKDISKNELCQKLYMILTGSVSIESRARMTQVTFNDLNSRPLPIDYKWCK